MVEGKPRTCRDGKRRKKSDRPLLPGKKKIMKSIQRLSQRPSGFPDRRCGPELVLDNPERESLKARLFELPSMSIGIEAVLC